MLYDIHFCIDGNALFVFESSSDDIKAVAEEANEYIHSQLSKEELIERLVNSLDFHGIRVDDVQPI